MATKKRKRRETFGMIDKLPSGRYRARYLDDAGTRHAAPQTFDTMTDARAYLAGIQTDMSRGEWTSPVARAAAKKAASTTLAEYAETWLALKSRRPRTLEEYRRLIRGPLADLASLPLSAISVETVKQWWGAQLAGGKLTQASRAYSLLSTVLGEAVDDGRISANPCRVKGAQTERTGKKVTPPTDEQFAAIVAATPEHLRALVYLAADAGLRWGEATELRRSDVVVEADRVLVTVARAVVKVRGEFIPGPTKTEAGVRSIYVYGDAAAAIARHVDADRFRFNPGALLFPASDGVSHLSQSTFWRHWNAARTAAGRPDMPFHALRHYAGTRYAQAGATPRETMTRLGHTSLAVALRYQHATDRDAEIAARMAKRPAGTA